MENRPAKVLVAPLDWGLGHATRSVPVIRELITQGAEVVICASGYGKILLADHFPSCQFIDIPGITIRYPEKGAMALSMLFQMPSLLRAIRKEHKQLRKLLEANQFTHVISDNRYGMFSSKVKTAFITHQVHIKSTRGLQFMEPVLFRMNKFWIEKFNELWIPDIVPPDNLSGELSVATGLTIPTKYIGILSRFTNPASTPEKKYDFIALLSGPEPQRSILEKKLLACFTTSGKKSLLVRGKPGDVTISETENIKCFNVITDSDLLNLLHPETTLICRPGYSTLMDLIVLKHHKTLFIPTPGQTEQEYLARVLKNNYGYVFVRQQDEFSIDNIPSGIPFHDYTNQSTLKKTIGEFLTSEG